MKPRTSVAAAFAIGALSGLVLSQLAGELRPAASAQPAAPAGTPSTAWLKGTTNDKLVQVEKHLRGLDVSMSEIGYRHDELVRAGKTRNWEYAQYQAEKIDLSLRLAIERRPKRARSAGPFLNQSIPPVLEAIKAKNPKKLDSALENLHAGCIQCHRAENVLYMGEQFATIQPTPAAVAATLADYQRWLTPEYLADADHSQGRRLFAAHCANCHRLFAEGADIGPNLTGLQRSNLDYVLRRIVDPNAMIGRDYQMLLVVTADGRSIAGLVKHEDQSSLTLQTATEKVTIARSEIEERSVSKVSMMPEGLLQKLTREQARDLVGYLQGAGQVPPPPGHLP